MKKGNFPKVSADFLLCLLIVAVDCFCAGGCIPTEKYKRTVHLSAPLSAGSLFEAQTHDGYINITGADVTQCSLTATIIARADTEQNAQKLSEEVEVKLIPSSNKLTAKIQKPSRVMNQFVSVNLDVTVPSKSDLELTTDDGALTIENTIGSLKAKTSDGSITAEQITGNVELRTSDGRIVCTKIKADELRLHTSDGRIQISESSAKACNARTSDGRITCDEIQGDILNLKTSDGSIKVSGCTYSALEIVTGDGRITCDNISAERLNCRSSDGSVYVRYAKTAPGVLDVDISTADGSIEFISPPDLSAVVDVSTADGSISTELPITLKGKIGKSLKGTVGKGQGKICLKTNDGSIKIK